VADGDWEVEFRRRRFAQLRTAYEQSSERVDEEQLERLSTSRRLLERGAGGRGEAVESHHGSSRFGTPLLA
jgi:hypothetical protein